MEAILPLLNTQGQKNTDDMWLYQGSECLDKTAQVISELN